MPKILKNIYHNRQTLKHSIKHSIKHSLKHSLKHSIKHSIKHSLNNDDDDYYYRMTSPISYEIKTFTSEEMKKIPPLLSDEERHCKFIESITKLETPLQTQRLRDKLIKHLEQFNTE